MLKQKQKKWANSFKKKSQRVVTLFTSTSWDTDILVTLGDFMLKTQKLDGKSVNWFNRIENWGAVFNHNYMCHVCY